MSYRLLDLFCCAGGAAMGYHQAGFEVVGVDKEPQPNYPFEFIQGDALEVLAATDLSTFDAIHASPPCQGYSSMWVVHRKDHPLLIEDTRSQLEATGLPWVMENVEGAPMASAGSLFGAHGLKLCGSMFGLTIALEGETYELRRHRLFESNLHLIQPPCRHRHPTVGIYGHGDSGPRGNGKSFSLSNVEQKRELMQMPWASREEISEAIPPAFTRFIGEQLVGHITTERDERTGTDG